MKVGEYIFLAGGCVSLGIIVTFVVLGVCERFGIKIDEHWWIVAIPAVLSLIINVTFIEIYRRFRKSNKRN
jgi:hypothetical protein